MAELVYAHDSKSCGVIHGGSSPPFGTSKEKSNFVGSPSRVYPAPVEVLSTAPDIATYLTIILAQTFLGCFYRLWQIADDI